VGRYPTACPFAGTGIDNDPPGEPNPEYDNWLSILDAMSGKDPSLTSAKVPPGWANGPYWTATADSLASSWSTYAAWMPGGLFSVIPGETPAVYVAVQVL
jgi:hypothetical protein